MTFWPGSLSWSDKEFVTTEIETQALQALEREPWFGTGLRFTCTGCGKCCTGAPGSVYLSQGDAARLAEALSLSVDAFIRDYTRMDDGTACAGRPALVYGLCVPFGDRLQRL